MFQPLTSCNQIRRRFFLLRVRINIKLRDTIANFFSKCYHAGAFLTCLKIANVQIMPKNPASHATNPTYYGSVAICFAITKPMVNYHLTRYIKSHSLISDRQYSFRENISTDDLTSYPTEKQNRVVRYFGESKVIAIDISRMSPTECGIIRQSLSCLHLVSTAFSLDLYRVFQTTLR